MKQSFKNLSAAKQEQILIAATKEFFEYGFNDASTNRIAKDAGISKGALYYYFDDKANIYDSCQTHAFMTFKTHLNTYTQAYEGYIERLIRVHQFKQAFQVRHPVVFNFFVSQFYKGLFPKDITYELHKLNSSFQELILEELDLNLFKADVNVEHAMQLIRWTIKGYEKDVEQKAINNQLNFDNFDQCFEDSYVYFETLKKIYYKSDS